jgi:hypothetical protein
MFTNRILRLTLAVPAAFYSLFSRGVREQFILRLKNSLFPGWCLQVEQGKYESNKASN